MEKIKRALLTVLAVCLTLASLSALADVPEAQEIAVSNTPVKGRIRVEKQGPVLTGFAETRDAWGHTLHIPLYAPGRLAGAVFEVKAAEKIIGRDGTEWFDADETAAVITTTDAGPDETPPLPLGHYYVTETKAPDGYRFEKKRYDVFLAAKDRVTPVVTEEINVGNEYLPAVIELEKQKEIIVTERTGEDTVSRIELVPGEGFIFGLFNKSEIPCKSGSLPADSLIASGITDAEGRLAFEGSFPHGEYYIRELAAPAGWAVNPERFPVVISDAFREGDERIHVKLDKPIPDEIIKALIHVSKTDLTGEEYIPGARIEVRNAAGETVACGITGNDGRLPEFPAVPGHYTFRELTAPPGYELFTGILEFDVTPDGTIEGETSVRNDINRFSVLKTEEDGRPLRGVEFGLYESDGTCIASAVTDENGLAVFERVPYGEYYISEKTPLPGYVRDTTRVPVTVDGTFVNPTEPLSAITNHPARILIRKTDTAGLALPGAEFGLFDTDGKLVMTSVSDKDGLVLFERVENGEYTVRELTAPDGYLINHTAVRITVDDGYVNPAEPQAVITDTPKRVPFRKIDTSGKPVPGAVFSLINAATKETVQSAESDANGEFIFTDFDYGVWTVRETKAPDGYCRMDDYTFEVRDGWAVPEPILLTDIPNHYEFLKTDASGNPLAGVKFNLETPDGKVIARYESGRDGSVRITGLEKGTYIIRETETLPGFTVTGETIKISVDDKYTVPSEPRKLVNHTVIQTGVNSVMTGATWTGIGLIAAGALFLIIRRKRGNARERSGKDV